MFDRRRTAAVTVAFLVGVATASAGAAQREPRIVNGQPAPPGAFPFMAALVAPDRPAEDGEFCGGALIAPKIVVTAAHCIEGSAPGDLQVVVGRSTLSNRDGQRIRVAKIAENPRADIHRPLPVYDSAQVRLRDPATETPVPLATPSDAALFAAGQPALVIGWGVIGERSVEQPDQLYQTTVNIFSTRDCRRAYGVEFDPQTTMCAAAPGTDSCYGDSGGPLLVSDGAGAWLEAGLVSAGRGCARPNYPGTYAKVAALLGFIQDPHLVFAPFNKQRPYLTGSPRIGHRVFCHKGNWFGSSPRYVFSWALVRGGQVTKTVAFGRRWRVRERYQGKDVGCLVNGFNSGGYSTARSHGFRVEQPKR